MTLQSKRKIIGRARYMLTPLLLIFVSVSASAQTNTFPSSGNVGIGTTSPAAKLQVQQDVNGDNSIYVLNNGGGTLSRSLILFGEATSNAKYAYFGHFGANYAGSGPAQPRATLFVGADAGGSTSFLMAARQRREERSASGLPRTRAAVVTRPSRSA